MIDIAEVEQVAKALTKAQRVAIVEAFDVGDGSRTIWADTNRNAANALHRKQLADDFFVLTGLGLAVRKHLEGKPS